MKEPAIRNEIQLYVDVLELCGGMDWSQRIEIYYPVLFEGFAVCL